MQQELSCRKKGKQYKLDVCFSMHRCICVEKKNQLDGTEWFIELIICSTCFGNFYAHHQELETSVYVCYYRLWCAMPCCWLLEVRCSAAGYACGMRDVTRLSRATSLIPNA